MIVLVTGAAGFIGFHLCKRLLENGYEVVGYDNINPYYDPKLKKERIKLLEEISDKKNIFFKLICSDLEDIINLKNTFKKYKPKHVINLAAQAGVRYSIDNPSAYIQSNIVGFANILECCRDNKIEHLIYASSSSVYGGNTNYPFKESQGVDHPVSLYAASKRSNELMAHSYSHLYDLPCTGLRFFTVYGPWGRPDMALFKFTKNILKRKTITVYNKGNHERDFTYIDDVVKFTLLASNNFKNLKNKLPPYRILNIGSSSPIKLNKFIKIIEKILNIKSKKKMLTLQKGDMVKTYSNSTKIFKLFKCNIKSNHYENVLKFINWYKKFYLKRYENKSNS